MRLAFILSLGACGYIFWVFSGYYTSFSVKYNQYNHPFIEVKLGKTICPMGIQIGGRFPLFLSLSTLEALDKKPAGSAICHQLNGTVQEIACYCIPKLQINNLVLTEALAYECDENQDSLGKFLGGQWNLLLDFPHDQIIACDRFSKLQSKKIANSHWIPIPFELHEYGVVFHVQTEKGTKKLALNTTSSFNMLNANILSESSNLSFLTSSIFLEGNPFGRITFEMREMPDDLNAIDGFLGMDFMKEYSIYLDCTHQKAYISPPPRYFESIPIAFSKRNDPIITIAVEDQEYFLKFDSGSSFPFSLNKEILQNLNKMKEGSASWYDFRGKHYQAESYTVPKLKIGHLQFYSAIVNEDNAEFHKNTTLMGEPIDFSGTIGFPILLKYNLFLDFPRSKMYACKDHLLLQQTGLLSDRLLAIPFSIHPDGIFLDTQTDQGRFRLMLDTGSTITAIRGQGVEFTHQFSIGGHDFGKHRLVGIDLSPQFDFDGFLGMDFLLEHSVFIDYDHQILYFDTP